MIASSILIRHSCKQEEWKKSSVRTICIGGQKSCGEIYEFHIRIAEPWRSICQPYVTLHIDQYTYSYICDYSATTYFDFWAVDINFEWWLFLCRRSVCSHSAGCCCCYCLGLLLLNLRVIKHGSERRCRIHVHILIDLSLSLSLSLCTKAWVFPKVGFEAGKRKQSYS